MKAEQYRVLRDHIGPNGELFSPKGDMCVREAIPHEIAHLVPLTLELIVAAPETAADETKPDDQGGGDTIDGGHEPDAPTETSDAAPENKAEAAPETAAAPAPARKRK